MTESPEYLFVLNPAFCGSTALAHFLLSSRRAAALNGKAEGQWLPSVRDLMTPDRWNPAKSMPWEIIRGEWLARWREAIADKPEARILIEKSPPHLVRAKRIEEEFVGAKFILFMRDPYPWCASFMSRASKNRAARRIPGNSDTARIWLARARQQRWNSQNLRETLSITYEEFVADPLRVKEKVSFFCPALNDLQTAVQMTIKDYPPSGIVDHNARQIGLLSPAAKAEISAVLSSDSELVQHFGYRVLD